MPKYSATLSGRSFRALAEKVRKYREWLESKTEELVDALAQAGYDSIQSDLEFHEDTGATLDSMEWLSEGGNGLYKVSIRVTSDAILFLEFGSGTVGRDAAQHPLAGEKGYGAGTFPGKGHWDDPNGWIYYNAQKGNQMGWTKGQVASMPMFKGSMAIKRDVERIVREVFK